MNVTNVELINVCLGILIVCDTIALIGPCRGAFN
jgi:hypothetical protein